MLRLINMEVSQAACETIVNALSSPAVSTDSRLVAIVSLGTAENREASSVILWGVIRPQAHDTVKSCD